jgi:hypothetical protein
VARLTLRASLKAFVCTLDESRRLAVDAYRWALPRPGGRRPIISSQRRDALTEFSFFRAFLAWETFLEESFVLYLAGRKPPRARGPRRYSFPPTLRDAEKWVIPEGQRYATWTEAPRVIERAERFFQGGRPYAPVLQGNRSVLDESRDLRNAIAHASANARAKFENLVRNRMRTLPQNVTVGAFLGMTVPRSSPPVSFLEHYVRKLESAAHQIVPA